MKPIKLQNGLWAVSVPENSYQPELNIEHEDEWYVLEFYHDNDDEESGFYGECVQYDVHLNPGDYEILGTVDKDTISFDVTPFIESEDLMINGKLQSKLFYDYQMCTDDVCEWFCKPELSFRSLLSSHGITDYEKLIILKEI